MTTLAIVAVGVVLPATPFAAVLGFTMPPVRYFVLLVAAVILYLGLVEIAKSSLCDACTYECGCSVLGAGRKHARDGLPDQPPRGQNRRFRIWRAAGASRRSNRGLPSSASPAS